jgi:GDP-L-fucose synthase
MPTNIYGPNDNFDLNHSHVIPALIRKFTIAKNENLPTVEVWGTGKARREFLYVDDLADSIVFCMDNFDSSQHLNIGFGNDITVLELAQLISKIVGFKGEISFNSDIPDGTPQKLLDSSRIFGMGWKPSTSLSDGLKLTVAWYIKKFLDVQNVK